MIWNRVFVKQPRAYAHGAKHKWNQRLVGIPSKHDTALTDCQLEPSYGVSEECTHEIATRRIVKQGTKMAAPPQSNFFNASTGCRGRCGVRKKNAIRTRLILANGKQIQKIHLHVTAVVKPPPITGPQEVPRSHTRLMTAMPLARSRSESKSAITIYVIARNPPPPTPCVVRPTRVKNDAL